MDSGLYKYTKKHTGKQVIKGWMSDVTLYNLIGNPSFLRLEVICNCIRKLYLSILKYFALDIPTEEQLIFEHLNVQLVLHLLRYTIGLKKLAPFLIQSEVKPKPIVTRLHAFSRALCQLHKVIITPSSFDWFTVLFVSF